MPRCPECDFELWKAAARDVLIEVRGGHRPRPVDLIFCSRCGWCRFATADDLGALDQLPTVGA